MTYWMSFHSPAYGMHWGFVKPYPSTHGCVRMPLNSARKVFDMTRVGTPAERFLVPALGLHRWSRRFPVSTTARFPILRIPT